MVVYHATAFSGSGGNIETDYEYTPVDRVYGGRNMFMTV